MPNVPVRRCPPLWLAFRNHCYLYKTERKTFQEAERYCSNLSIQAHLVSISDDEENQLAFRYAQLVHRQDFWIGYSDAQSEGNFVWTDGNGDGFTAWNHREPNNGGGNQDCAYYHLKAFKWDDLLCSTALNAFMCKVPKNEGEKHKATHV